MSHRDELCELRLKLSMERDYRKRQEILDHWLATVQEEWNEFFEHIATEEDPVRMCLLACELVRLSQERRSELATGERAAVTHLRTVPPSTEKDWRDGLVSV